MSRVTHSEPGLPMIIQDFNRRNMLAQAHSTFSLVLTGKTPNSAAISDVF